MLIDDMKSCEQTPGISIYDHGVSVNAYYKDLKSHVLHGTELKFSWKLPDWIYDSRIWENQLECVDTYQIYHDCGKPYCIVEDDKGVHFPDHAEVSADTWLSEGGTEQEAKLIRMDMDVHLLKDIDVQEFSNRIECMTLLVTGLSEVHSNASMFGGIESVSFKIKWKHVNKRGRAILKCTK